MINDNKFVSLDDYREMKITNSGKLIVIKPKDNRDNAFAIVPLFCLVCKFPMKTADDSMAHRKYMCCSKCSFRFAAKNEEKWLAGWRPSQEELSSYKEEREKIEKTLFILK